MNKLSALANRFFPTKMRTLYKKGFMDKNMELTDKGVQELEAILVEDYIDRLVEAAEAEEDEEEEDKK